MDALPDHNLLLKQGPMAIILRLVATLALVSQTSGFNIVCYYTNWSQYRPPVAAFFPEDVDPTLCTHIVFAFCSVDRLALVVTEFNDEEMYGRITNLKESNPKVKILLALGGENAGSIPFLELGDSEYNRQGFISNLAYTLQRYGFDGFELHWKYPGTKNKSMFTSLVQTIKEYFENHEDRGDRYQLGVAVAGTKWNIDTGLDVANVARYADYLHIMTYDLHGTWDQLVGFNSPLYAYPEEENEARYLNIDWVANYYVSKGAPKEKIHIGIASYGRSFTLKDPQVTSVLSPADSAGDPGPQTNSVGIMSYPEICEVIKDGGKVEQVQSQGNPYVVKDDQWIGYEDVVSVTKKALYVREKMYGGVIFWSLDYDDFRGAACNENKYPLLSAINKVLQSNTGIRASTGKTSKNTQNKLVGSLMLLVTWLSWAVVGKSPD